MECGNKLAELYELWQNPPPVNQAFNLDIFKLYLREHPNFESEYKLISDGYPLYLSDRNTANLSTHVRNLVRNKQDMLAILTRMIKEAKRGQITGTTTPCHYTLNLLCVPKKDNDTKQMTAIRVARHGSYSTRDTVSINDKIDRDFCKIPTLPNIRKYVKLLIQYNYVSLRDLKDAFRQLGLAKQDRNYIQYVLFGLRFRDNMQAYGVASAAANCQHFSNILIWIYENVQLSQNQRGRILVHIDDFLMAAQSVRDCKDMTLKFDQMCADLNVKISHEKDENWVQKGVVHGFGFDLSASPKLTFIPDHKFVELLKGLLLCIKHRYATGEALESICGKIMHWSQFRKYAKVLCFRLLAFIFRHIRTHKHLKFKIFHISDEIILDFRFWIRYAQYMRVVTMESILYTPSITVMASSDACNFGAGFVVNSEFGYYKFNTQPNKFGVIHSEMSINYQEAHAVIMLLHNYKHILTGRHCLLFVDNTSVMWSLIRNWSTSAQLMEYIHEIVLLLCTFRITLRVEYISSFINGLSDSLSRGEIDRFNQLISDYDYQINSEPTPLEYYPHLRLIKEGPENNQS